MAEHIPGPWHVAGGTLKIFSEAKIAGGIQMQPVEINVADVRGWGALQYRKDGHDIMKANARLIAAAPDMLEALRLAKAYIDRPITEMNPAGTDKRGWADASIAVDSAIAKATGATDAY